MAPQNVSFIESATSGDEDPGSGSGPGSGGLKRLPERLSQLNISSGSKTYRVHSDKESPSPSPTRNRPTISSTFKQHRRGSGDNSGPSSIKSGAGPTVEEEEALANMKTERLKDDKDAAAGFEITFDDDSKPRKPKPMLKERRSSKKTSLSEFSSDGSNSSRKENVPPEVMICIVSVMLSLLISF